MLESETLPSMRVLDVEGRSIDAKNSITVYSSSLLLLPVFHGTRLDYRIFAGAYWLGVILPPPKE